MVHWIYTVALRYSILQILKIYLEHKINQLISMALNLNNHKSTVVRILLVTEPVCKTTRKTSEFFRSSMVIRSNASVRLRGEMTWHGSRQHCCIFRPAFGCCPLETPVEIVFFSAFAAKNLKKARNLQQISIKNTFFCISPKRWLPVLFPKKWAFSYIYWGWPSFAF